MSITETYDVEEYRLVDGEKRSLSVLHDFTADLEWNANGYWEPIAAAWTDRPGGQDIYRAAYNDADKATWYLLMQSWEFGQHDCKVADTVDAPEMEDAA